MFTSTISFQKNVIPQILMFFYFRMLQMHTNASIQSPVEALKLFEPTFLRVQQFFLLNLRISKTHKTPWPLWGCGNFFPLPGKSFQCSITAEST